MTMAAALICALVYLVLQWLDPYILGWQCLNRPLVVAPIIGTLLGDPVVGITMGASLEAIFMGISAVGGSVPSDCLSGSIIAVAYAILVGGEDAVETGLTLALAIGTVMASVSSMLMALWGSLAAYWEKLAAEANPNKFLVINLLVSLITMVPGAVIIYFGVAYGVDGLQSALVACPAWVMTGLAAAGSMMTAVGFGILLSQIWSGELAVFFFVGFVLTKSLGLPSLGVAVLAAAVALLFFIIQKDSIERHAPAQATAEADAVVANKPANTEEDFF